jgi:hypothetical protein
MEENVTNQELEDLLNMQEKLLPSNLSANFSPNKIIFSPNKIISISNGSKFLFSIDESGKVESSIEDASEAGKIFIESLRIYGSPIVERIKILEDRLLKVDLKLASIEDVAHGEFGKEITEIRGIIALFCRRI